MMPPPKMQRFRSLLCAVDFSQRSARALEYAHALAASCGGRLSVVFAADPLLANAAAAAYNTRLVEQGAAKDAAAFVRKTLGPPALAQTAIVVAVGKPGSVIIEQANRLHPDVIVLATNARHGASKLFFGSTTEAVLRRFSGAVLVVPPRARAPRGPWPGGSVVAAISDDLYRRAEINAAARMAEHFGAWLSIVPVSVNRAGSAADRAQMIIYPLPRAGRIRMFRQGGAAYHFICGARSPVLVIRTAPRRARRPAVPSRAA